MYTHKIKRENNQIALLNLYQVDKANHTVSGIRLGLCGFLPVRLSVYNFECGHNLGGYQGLVRALDSLGWEQPSLPITPLFTHLFIRKRNVLGWFVGLIYQNWSWFNRTLIGRCQHQKLSTWSPTWDSNPVRSHTPWPKTIKKSRAWIGAQLTTCAQKLCNFACYSMLSLRFFWSWVCIFL